MAELSEAQRRAVRRALSGQEDEPVELTFGGTIEEKPVGEKTEVRAQDVIAALQRQVGEYAARVAILESRLADAVKAGER